MKYFSLVALLFATLVQASQHDRISCTADGKVNGKDVTFEIPSTAMFYLSRSATDSIYTEVGVGDRIYPSRLEALFVGKDSQGSTVYEASDLTGFYLCSYKKCPVRRVEMKIVQHSATEATGELAFRVKSKDSKKDYKLNLSCEVQEN